MIIDKKRNMNEIKVCECKFTLIFNFPCISIERINKIIFFGDLEIISNKRIIQIFHLGLNKYHSIVKTTR